jgi:acetyl esterase/lipase
MQQYHTLIILNFYTLRSTGHCTKKIFFYIVGGGFQLGSPGTAATNWPIVQPLVIMMMEKLVE